MKRANRVLAVGLALALLAGCGTFPAIGPQAPALDPVTAQRYQQAVAALHKGELSHAEAGLRALARSNPELPGVHANLGVIYRGQGKLKEAEAAFKNAIAVQRNNARYYNELGIVYRQQGRFNDAREAYEQALILDERYTNACLNLGILYDLYLGAPDKALEYYRRAQAVAGTPDETVTKWILELEKRPPAAERTAMSERG